MRVESLLRWAIAVALATLLLKFAAWWITGSVGLLSDAMESFVNLASAGFALAMVAVARRPADADHPSGHSKAEYFSSGFEGLLILGAALAIAWAAIHRWLAPQPLQALDTGLVLSVLSAALNGGLAWRMRAGAREHRSIVLEADARHLMADVWTTGGVVLGLIGVLLTGWLWLDPLLALLVALNILREGGHLVRRSVEGLMDSAVEPEVRAHIDRTLAAFVQPPMRFDHLVTRRAGQRRFVDLHMHLPAGWSLGRAAGLRGSVEAALVREVPGLRVSIQMLPLDVEAQAEELAEPRK